MSRREELIENYEDALFAVLMDKVAEEEGARLREENQRLKEDPDAAVPEHVDAVAQETIRKAFAGKSRRSTLRVVRRVVNTVAVVVLVFAALFATAYAAFPEVQLRTLNLLIQTSDVASKFMLTTGNEGNSLSDKNPDGITICGYLIPDLSSVGFSLVDHGEDKHGGWILYKSDRDETIHIDIAIGNAEYVDTEEAVGVEDIEIHGYFGMLIEKENRISIVWSELDHEAHISVICSNLNSEFAIQTAEQINFLGT